MARASWRTSTARGSASAGHLERSVQRGAKPKRSSTTPGVGSRAHGRRQRSAAVASWHAGSAGAHANLPRDKTMSRRKPIGLGDRQRVLELAGQGLSARQIAQRLEISVKTDQQTLAKGLTHCDQCGRTIGRGRRCRVCALLTGAGFSERLKAFRTAADLSQLQLALNVGVSDARVRQWESGQKQPAEHELEMLAEALGLTVQELTGIACRP